MTRKFAAETSLYLRQHADNPVAWWPWCEEAFAEAARRDCPVLLSIGYSSCHWCHVMAHESFEDELTATQMNADFVNIKVDREERPDIDQIYQRLHQLIHQQAGGWPLTAFLNPNTRLPLMTGTYFPNTQRYEMPAFSEVMTVVADAWASRRDELDAQDERMQTALGTLAAPPIGRSELPDLNTALLLGKQRLLQAADLAAGGFGGAPKFPMPTSLKLLLECAYYESGGSDADDKAAEHLRRSLIGMARGGLFDHVGGGFFRYSTDATWLIPHFEKMLYDNGQHLAIYAEALPLLGDPLLEQTVRRTADWLRTDMQLDGGGYCASVDADSPGGEGAYYVWQKREVAKLLDDDDAYALAETLYGLDQSAQFEGAWHLHRTDAWHEVLRRLNFDEAKGQRLLEQIWARLARERDTRAAPTRDDKIIVAWNGLAIKGMALAARALNQPEYLASARKALDFIRAEMWDGKVLGGVYDMGELKPQAFLDDYACLLDALLTMMAYRWRAEDAEMALALADEVMRSFRDRGSGGFFYTSEQDAPLPARHKPIDDSNVPSASALIATSLHQLGHLFARGDLLDAAEETLRSVAEAIAQQPEQHTALTSALRSITRLETTVVLFGPDADLAERQTWLKDYPNVRSFAIPTAAAEPLPAYLQADAAARDEVQIHLCYRLACQPPCTERDELVAMLANEKRLD